MSRTKVDNEVVLREIMGNESKREVFVELIARHAAAKAGLEVTKKIYADDVGSTAEAYGLTKAFLNYIVGVVVDQDVEGELAELSNKQDILALFSQ